MKGEFAQMISLASYGNEFLRSGRLIKDYFPGNIAFRYCNKIDFREDEKHFFHSKPQEIVVAENRCLWFERLKLNGCKKLRLYYQSSEEYGPASDHQLAGFLGGGGMLLLEALYDGYSDYWTSQWSMPEANNREKRFWSVNYKLSFKKHPITNR